jgi:predicted nucleic acid-binding protein
VHEFFSVVTHPRIYDPPSTTSEAIDQIEAWLESPSEVTISEGPMYWPAMSRLLSEGKITGPAVHDARIAALCDARIAALCIAHGVRQLWTADRDYSRFPELSVANPLR